MTTPSRRPLTHRQQEILGWIRRYIITHHRSPSYRDIGAGVGITSSNAVREYVQRFVADGHLIQQKGARGLSVPLQGEPSSQAPLFVHVLAWTGTEWIVAMRNREGWLRIDPFTQASTVFIPEPVCWVDPLSTASWLPPPTVTRG